jgi:hypothetical protein
MSEEVMAFYIGLLLGFLIGFLLKPSEIKVEKDDEGEKE